MGCIDETCMVFNRLLLFLIRHKQVGNHPYDYISKVKDNKAVIIGFHIGYYVVNTNNIDKGEENEQDSDEFSPTFKLVHIFRVPKKTNNSQCGEDEN